MREGGDVGGAVITHSRIRYLIACSYCAFADTHARMGWGRECFTKVKNEKSCKIDERRNHVCGVVSRITHRDGRAHVESELFR